jgi:hypothetical protein
MANTRQQIDPFGAMAVVFFRKLFKDKANKTWGNNDTSALKS